MAAISPLDPRPDDHDILHDIMVCGHVDPCTVFRVERWRGAWTPVKNSQKETLQHNGGAVPAACRASLAPEQQPDGDVEQVQESVAPKKCAELAQFGQFLGWGIVFRRASLPAAIAPSIAPQPAVLPPKARQKGSAVCSSNPTAMLRRLQSISRNARAGCRARTALWAYRSKVPTVPAW
jgi:hypothetical protein